MVLYNYGRNVQVSHIYDCVYIFLYYKTRKGLYDFYYTTLVTCYNVI